MGGLGTHLVPTGLRGVFVSVQNVLPALSSLAIGVSQRLSQKYHLHQRCKSGIVSHGKKNSIQNVLHRLLFYSNSELNPRMLDRGSEASASLYTVAVSAGVERLGGGRMNYEMLGQIIVFTFALFAGIEGIVSILRYKDRKRFIARLTESYATHSETEQPGFKLQVGSHWVAGEGAACSGNMAQMYAEALTRGQLYSSGVKIGNVLIGGHGLPAEPQMERERR